MQISITSMMMMFYLISMSSKNIISFWYYMEMGSFMFMFFMLKEKNSMKTVIIYFMMSFMVSMIMMSSIIFSKLEMTEFSMIQNNMNSNSNLVSLAMMMKMGMTPFHSWMFMMTENMKWKSMLILFSIQKIIPIWTIMMFGKIKFMMFFLVLSMMITPLMPLKSKNIFFLLSSSSIINSMWIIMSSMSSIYNTIAYSITYFMVNSNFIMIISKENSKTNSKNNPVNMTISMLSLMGFPPMPMFFMKLITIKSMMFNQFNFMPMSIFMLINNMISSIMYIKFSIIPMINMKNMLNLNKKNFHKNILTYISFMSPITYFMSISI